MGCNPFSGSHSDGLAGAEAKSEVANLAHPIYLPRRVKVHPAPSISLQPLPGRRGFRGVPMSSVEPSQ
jgi:hypothetical protein